mmetsp:Transcript_1610/g.5525  ORF Transcript_1610/g.5525 Transcript_1610/m.5525 type:complete len:202 (+) Transcript_1610:4634-5239(+)
MLKTLQAHISVMKFLRRGYQAPVVEPLLALSVLLHIVASIGSVINRVYQQGLTNAFFNMWKYPLGWHRFSGYFLTVAVVGHASATRILPLLGHYQQIIDISYATVSLDVIPGLFHLYYVLFTCAALYHTMYGLNQVIKRLEIADFTLRRRFWWIVIAASLLAGALVTWAVSVLPVPKRLEYLDIYRAHFPEFLLRWNTRLT